MSEGRARLRVFAGREELFMCRWGGQGRGGEEGSGRKGNGGRGIKGRSRGARAGQAGQRGNGWKEERERGRRCSGEWRVAS